MVLSNPGTQYMSLSAGIAQEPVSMTPRLKAETFCFAPALEGGKVSWFTTLLVPYPCLTIAPKFCPRWTRQRHSSLPLRRKEVRCTRWPFARAMPPSNPVMLRCPPSGAPPDDAVMSLGHALPVLSLHQPLPGRTQSPPPPTVSHAQDCSSTCRRTLPVNNSQLEITRAAGVGLTHKYAVLLY